MDILFFQKKLTSCKKVPLFSILLSFFEKFTTVAASTCIILFVCRLRKRNQTVLTISLQAADVLPFLPFDLCLVMMERSGIETFTQASNLQILHSLSDTLDRSDLRPGLEQLLHTISHLLLNSKVVCMACISLFLVSSSFCCPSL